MKNNILHVFFTFVVGICIIQCTTQEDEYPTADVPFEVSNLPANGSSQTYETWISTNGIYVLLGEFDINSSGESSLSSFKNVDFNDLADASYAFVALKEDSDTLDGPSSNVVLAADFEGNDITLNTEHPLVFKTNFNDVSATAYIHTPSTNLTTDEASGIWFYDPRDETSTLSLPLLQSTATWKYQVWLEKDGELLNMGKFAHTSTSDLGEVGTHALVEISDDSDSYSGSVSTLNFVGEDFVTSLPSGIDTPLDLNGWKVVISAEPVPDNDTSAPCIKLLDYTFSTTPNGGETIQLTKNEQLPTLTFSR